MKAFAYVNPANAREAVAALGTERNRILPLAGGMDLLGMMKDYLVTPERLVNVKGLDQAIAAVGPGLRIGAAARVADVAGHADIGARYPALAEAAAGVGTPQIRHQGTVGGNLMQRPRCWYFRNEEFDCLKKGGARCFAVDGENQHHAIFGEGPCHIVHPSSLAVPLIAYGATIGVLGPGGAREVDAGAFYQMPSANLYGETVLQPDEIVTHVTLPAAPTRSASYEARFKKAHDWPLAAASVSLVLSGGRVTAARVVLGAVAPVPWRAPAAERALVGQSLSEAVAAEAGAAAVAGARPMSGNAYKVQIAKTAVKRAVMKAAGMDVV
ncbi:MAG: xanthine dehydrogenase family protein subunit M [Vicinamibacterales bacterium]